MQTGNLYLSVWTYVCSIQDVNTYGVCKCGWGGLPDCVLPLPSTPCTRYQCSPGNGRMDEGNMYLFTSISPIRHGCLHLRPGESYRASSCSTTVACRPWRMRQPCIHGLHMRAMAPGLPHDRILCVSGALDRDYLLRLGVEPKSEKGGPWRWERRAPRCRPGRSACLREYWPNIHRRGRDEMDICSLPTCIYLPF